MAGTKRHRGAAKAASSSEQGKGHSSAISKKADTATTKKPSNHEDLLWKVVEHLLELVGPDNTSRAEEVLQAFADAKVSMDKPAATANGRWDAYWLILATHVMNRLLQEDNGKSLDRLLILSAISDLSSRVWTTDKSRLEKSSNLPSSRSLVARAMLSATVSALHCIIRAMEAEPSKSRTAILFGATAALDRLVHLQDTNGDCLEVDWTSYELESACRGFPASEAEEDCMTRLDNFLQLGASPPPSKKRATSRATRRKLSPPAGTSASVRPASSALDIAGFAKALETLLGDASSQRMDARNPVKRWASMALVWYRGGPVHLLRASELLASHGGEAVMLVDANSPASELMKILCRILAIVAESGTSSGVRPPVGGMDNYILGLESKCLESLPSLSTSGTNGGRLTDKTRDDIRDLTVKAMHDVLQVHHQCLRESPSKIVNDIDGSAGPAPEATKDETNVETEVYTAPNLATILSSLCRSAALSVSNSGYSEQNDWVKTMSTLVAAFSLQIAADPDAALDCRLFQSAVSNLTDTLRLLDHQTPSSSALFAIDTDEVPTAMEKIFQLSKPLPKPVVPERQEVTSDEMSFEISKKSTFAGMWTLGTEFSNEDALSLLMRALRPSEEENEGVEHTLITLLTDITRRAYDTRVQSSTWKQPLPESEELDTKPKAKTGRKRTAKSTGTRKSKQQKTTNESVVTSDDIGTATEYTRITNLRAALARDALIAIRFCLTWKVDPCSRLTTPLRDNLTSDQAKDLLYLGELLDKVLVKTRLGASKFATPKTAGAEVTPGEGASFCCSTHSNDYTVFEKNLWNTHMAMSQTLGRGRAEYDGNTRFIFSEAERKSMFQYISGGRNSQWPLSLPAAHHAFLAANLAGSADGPEESSPEQFLVKQCIKSIAKALQNLGDIQGLPKETKCMHLHDGILLPYHDARTLIMAFSRLPPDYQRKSLEELLGTLHLVLQKCQNNAEDLATLTKNEESSSFVARVIVVVSAMVSIIGYSRPLRLALFAHAALNSRQPPSFYTSSEWYCCERCFMGLFSDWESTGLPELETPVPTPNLVLLKDKTLKELKAMLEMAFDLGFETAKNDRCYLLFASWNGLGKLHTEGGSERIKSSDSISLQINPDKFPRRILQLRDDVSLIHNELNSPDGQRSMLSTKMRSNLKSIVHRANLLSGRLLEKATDGADGVEDLPISLFGLLWALPTYVSASIAAHTKPGNDYFSSALAKQDQRRTRRQRGYSSESERMASDGESVETEGVASEDDVRGDAMSRLHECCDAFGAAPIHPDWLDVSCSFQEGIRASDAVDNAETALRMLNKLASTALAEYQKYLLKAIRIYAKADDADSSAFLDVILSLLPWNNHEPTYSSPLGPGIYSDERDWKEDISALFDLPGGLLDLIMDDSVVMNTEAAAESWCPNAAQRIVGRLHDRKRPLGGWETSIPELRAGGEWELLLSEALVTACLDVKRYPEEVADDIAESDCESEARVAASTHLLLDPQAVDSAHKALKRAQLWRLILTVATSHMLPAAALLRMGINKAGRQPHPFSFHENNQDPYDVAPLSFAERLEDTTYTSPLVKMTCHETMALVSKLSTHGDDSLSNCCHAIAAHLFLDTNFFLDLEGIESIRVSLAGLNSMLRAPTSVLQKASAKEVVPYIIERLTLILEDYSFSQRGSDAAGGHQEVERLLCFLGASNNDAAETVLGNSDKFHEILKRKSTGTLPLGEGSSDARSRDEVLDIMKDLVAVLLGAPVDTNDRSRACAAILLGKLVASERSRHDLKPSDSSLILDAVIKPFNDASLPQVKKLVLEDLCCVSNHVSPYSLHKVELSQLLQYMMSILEGGEKFEKARFIYDVLLESFMSWPRSSNKQDIEPAFDALLSFGCRFNSLSDVGWKILALESGTAMAMEIGDAPVDMELVMKFFDFVKHMRDAFSRSGNDAENALAAKETESSSFSPKAIAQLGRRCSFVEKTGYHGQHWYNCYTCGLVWEKGCCTLCALVCHKGHEVSYSRYSSFFCDCAAEDGTASSHNRIKCQCIVPLSPDDVKKLQDGERSSINVPEERIEVSSKKVEVRPNFPSLGVKIAYSIFPEESKLAIANLMRSTFGEPWFTALFELLQKQFSSWQSANASFKDILPEPSEAKQASSRPIHRISPHLLKLQLRGRKAAPLDLKQMQCKTLIPVRSAKGFQTRMSADTSTNAHLLAKLSRHDIARSNVVSDSRGRLVIAEPCSLLFCTSMPAIATRYGGRAYETPLSRHQMCILGSASVSFNIVGMHLCSENERHLAVWGVSDACVFVLKATWDGIETVIDLALDRDQNDSEADYLVKCDFIPGSQTNLVVGCGRYVRVFDISRSKENRSNAVVAYNLGFEASLRDIALVPMNLHEGSEQVANHSRRPRQEMISRMFMLLENGRLHSVELKADADGRIESPSDLPCELSGSISLPIAGVRQRTGSIPGSTGSTVKSLGEGSRLVYLRQSRLLLYKCVSSCVLALLLDNEGNVEGSFELIPHVLSSDTLWKGMEGDSIVGPYIHWTELGMAYHDEGVYFRVACIGRSSRTNQPKIICIEFNERDVRVREVVWSSTGSIGLSLSLSFEGLCAFSMPVIGDANSERRCFGERAFLCAATSAGSLLFFGEAKVDTVQTHEGYENPPITLVSLSGIPSVQVKKPKFPLTIFEKLRNVSECEEVVFVGEGTGCDSAELKSRLLRDRSSSVVCHRREGCTLSIALRPRKGEKTNDVEEDLKSKSLEATHAIVALRILVGSAPSHIPSKVYIQGRPFDLTPRMKKWYSMPLTNEEIALGVRQGMVSVGIGPCFDSGNNSSIDSIEVYAAEREELDPWIPKTYINSTGDLCATNRDVDDVEASVEHKIEDEATNGVLLTARSLAHLCELCPEPAKSIVATHRDFLRKLVEETSFTRERAVSETVRDLLMKIEPDDRVRNSIYDESILHGWRNAVLKAIELFDDASIDGEETRWGAVRCMLRECLQSVTTIASERPMNYLQTMENVAESEMSKYSLGTDISRIILLAAVRQFPCQDLIDGPGGIIDLCLTEIAIELNTERGKHLAGFEVVKKFLESKNREVAEVSCRAVIAFCDRQGSSNQDGADLFRLLQGTRLVAYKCDSCGLCPMKEIRYTFLEEALDIEECYALGEKFARESSYDSNLPVTIGGRTVGAESKLTCTQLQQMQPVPLEKMDVEQVDVQSTARTTSTQPSGADGDEDLQRALRLSLGEGAADGGQNGEESQAYEDFASSLFSNTLEVLSGMIKTGRRTAQLSPILRLVLNLIRKSTSIDLRNDRARRYATHISQGVSLLLSRRGSDTFLAKSHMWTIVSCIRSIYLLLLSEQDAVLFLDQLHAEEDNKLKTHPDVVCEVHKVPAVRRRSAKGKNKDRRFYVCGKERGQRCNFFKWADEVETKSDGRIRVNSQLREIAQIYLWNRPVPGDSSFNVILCQLLEKDFFDDDDDDFDPLPSLTNQNQEKKRSQNCMGSLYEKESLESDFIDGVFCSREKLLDTVAPGSKHSSDEKKEVMLDMEGSGDSKVLLLESCLELLALISDYKTEGVIRWFSLLCEIEISTNKAPEIRILARKVLKALCGKKRALYNSIRDHFSYGFQLQALYRSAAQLLEAARLVAEKTRVCSVNWSRSAKMDWQNLSLGALIGSDELISEHDCSQGRLRKIGKLLDELWPMVKNGGGSWRRFCGQSCLPPSHRSGRRERQELLIVEQEMLEMPPIAALFWLACALPGAYQVKAMRLVDAALNDGVNTSESDGESREFKPEILEKNVVSALSGPEPLLPEDLLCSGKRKFSLDDVAAFLFRYILNGKSSDLRRVAYDVAAKLLSRMNSTERGNLFEKCLSSNFLHIGSLGKASVEYLNLLQYLAQKVDGPSSFAEHGGLVLDAFVNQIDSMKNDRSNGEWVVIESSHGNSTKKRFDLSPCSFCLKATPVAMTKDTPKQSERRDPASSPRASRIGGQPHQGSKRSALSKSVSRAAKKWHPEQVGPLSKHRIEVLKLGSASNEFNSFFALKHRLVVNDISLTVSDPRGRFVKSLAIYYSARPVYTDASELKSEGYQWQKCATLTLPRGASKATATMAYPVVAANLKVEYSDFYERPGGSKASDGSLLVHCPRCTRVVTNAHGVCGNCGEVAFQCRKCRHINYDRLDAFLCVECGYCASGSFSFEITAAVASNAIAILTDKDCERATKMMGAVNTMHEEVEAALSRSFRQIEERGQSSKSVESEFSAEMSRALKGLPPIVEGGKAKQDSYLDRLDKPGVVVKLSARPESNLGTGRVSAASDRTRSLLRLARQIRSESGSAWDRRRPGDTIIRHLGRGIDLDREEDQHYLIGLLEDGNVLESSETLSRTIANARAGQRGSGSGAAADGTARTGTSAADNAGNREVSAKEMLDECQRLHSFMREAQRERYELKRRIGAWQRLNQGALVDLGYPIQIDDSIESCHCSFCGPTVALHLLMVWSSLFKARPSQVEVDSEFLGLLLSSSGAVGKTLSDCMREVVKDVATKSETGAKLVLEELRTRLSATKDPVSAEILGKIMTVEGHFMAEEYSKLALELLANGTM